MKTCKSCGAKKHRSDYYDHREMSDGKMNVCKSCKRKSARKNWSLPNRSSDSRPDNKPRLQSDESIKWVPGLEGRYAVTDHGRVFSYTKNWGTRSGSKEVKQQKKESGYSEVQLSANGGRTDVSVHRLVLYTFRGPPPENEDHPHTRHLDGDRTNNDLENLKWGNASENWQDSKDHGTAQIGEKQYNSGLTAKEVYEIRLERKQSGYTYKKLGEMFDTTKSNIGRICRGESWKHVKGPIKGKDY